MVFSLYVRPEIKNVDGMRGKRIGITRFGSAPDISVRYALRKFNINPDKELTLIQLGFMATVRRGSRRLHRRRRGVAADAVRHRQGRLQRTDQHHRHELRLSQPGAGGGGLDHSQQARRDQPLHARLHPRVHKARTDREFTYKSMAKYTKINDQVVLQKAYDFYMTKVLENTPAVNMAGVVNVLEDLAKTVPAAKTAKPEQFVDMRFSTLWRKAAC